MDVRVMCVWCDDHDGNAVVCADMFLLLDGLNQINEMFRQCAEYIEAETGTMPLYLRSETFVMWLDMRTAGGEDAEFRLLRSMAKPHWHTFNSLKKHIRQKRKRK